MKKPFDLSKGLSSSAPSGVYALALRRTPAAHRRQQHDAFLSKPRSGVLTMTPQG